MATKKRKRQPSKRTKTITGKDASILSFVARNGLPSVELRREIQKYLTPHVVKAAFSATPGESSNKKSRRKKGQKTLSHLRSLAKTNAAELPSFRNRTALPLTWAKSAGK